jgi:hypothetical protein
MVLHGMLTRSERLGARARPRAGHGRITLADGYAELVADRRSRLRRHCAASAGRASTARRVGGAGICPRPATQLGERLQVQRTDAHGADRSPRGARRRPRPPAWFSRRWRWATARSAPRPAAAAAREGIDGLPGATRARFLDARADATNGHAPPTNAVLSRLCADAILRRRTFMTFLAIKRPGGCRQHCVCGVPPHAADFPSQPVRIVVPFAPGGGTDMVARTLADRSSDRLWAVGVLVDNRPGANSVIATRHGCRRAGRRPHTCCSRPTSTPSTRRTRRWPRCPMTR